MATCTRQRWAPQNVDAYFVTKADDYGFPGYKKSISRVGVLVPGAIGGTAPLAISQIINLTEVTEARTGTMYLPDNWKFYRLSGNREGTVVQLKIEYTGGPIVDFEQLQIGFEVIGRRPRFN